MRYINVGVEGASTKEALIKAVEDDPSKVEIYSSAKFGEKYDGPLSDMPIGVQLSVSGPDPFNRRDWFATIIRSRDGSRFKVR